MTEPIPALAAKFETYLRRMSELPPGYTLIYLSLAECLSILDDAAHVALVSLNGVQTPVKYGVGVPTVGSFYPCYQTREGERWIKILASPWSKVWTDSPASAVSSEGSPYAPITGLAVPMIAYAGIDYGTDEHSITPIDADPAGTNAAYGLAAPGVLPGYASVDALVAPVSNPRIDILALDAAGLVYWVHGAEAAEPVAPAVPVGSVEMGRVYLPVTATLVGREVDEGGAGATQAYLMTDTRRDEIVPTRFRPVSFNQSGADFSGMMERPSTAGRLALSPTNIYGDGRDGAGVINTGTTVNLHTASICGRATADAAYVQLNNWGQATGGYPLFAPPPAGVVAGDFVMAIIVQARENGDAAKAGACYVGRVRTNDGAGVVCELDPDQSFTVHGDVSTNYYAYVMRVPQYASLTLNGTAVLTGDAFTEGGPGALAIKTLTSGGTGSIRLDGCGFKGGDAGYQCSAGQTRANEGEGYKIPATRTPGLGQFGGGDGGESELCSFNGNFDGAGGSGGGGHGAAGSAGANGADNTGGGVFVATGDGGDGGIAYGSAAMVTTTQRSSAGFIYLGSGGGAGPGTGTHTNPSGKGGNGGGVVLLWTRTGQPNVNCDGNTGPRDPAARSQGAGGGAGGAIYVCCESLSGPTLFARSQTGGIGWADAFHHDGAGGAGADGRIHIARNSVSGGTVTPAPHFTDPPATLTTGEWLSEPVDLGRPGSVQRISAAWTLDGTDNIAPQFYLQGAHDVRGSDGAVRFPPAGAYWQAGDPTYPIVSGVVLSVGAVVTSARRYWRKGVRLDTGTTTPTDTPTVEALEIAGVA